MATSKDQRKKISGRLPRGSRAEIARRVGMSRMAVCLWFDGKSNSPVIESAAIDMLEEVTRREKDVNERLRALLSE